jgi:hypothetical protein
MREAIDLPTLLIWFGLILAADLAASGLWTLVSHIRNRRLDINCSNCEEPEKLSRTPDGRDYLCKRCMTAYIEENKDKGIFTEEDSKKAMRGFRKRRRRKS